MKQIILLIMTATISLVQMKISSISVKMKMANYHEQWIVINFYGDIFVEFYECLSNNRSLTCSADLTRDDKLPKIQNRRVTEIFKPELIRSSSEIYTDFFRCQYIFSKFSCERVPVAERKCEPQNTFQYFRLVNQSVSGSSCVGIRWTTSEDSLSYDKRIHTFEVCRGSCSETNRNDTTTRPEHSNVSESEPHKHEHDDDDEHDNDKKHKDRPRHKIDDYLDTKSHIIIAVVAGLGVIAILIIAAGIFRKRLLKLQDLKIPDSDSDFGTVTSRRTKVNKSESSRKFGKSKNVHPNSIILNPAHLSTGR